MCVCVFQKESKSLCTMRLSCLVEDPSCWKRGRSAVPWISQVNKSSYFGRSLWAAQRQTIASFWCSASDKRTSKHTSQWLFASFKKRKKKKKNVRKCHLQFGREKKVVNEGWILTRFTEKSSSARMKGAFRRRIELRPQWKEVRLEL